MPSQLRCLPTGGQKAPHPQEQRFGEDLALRRRAGKQAEEIAFKAFYCPTTSRLKFTLKEKTTIGFPVLEAQVWR